ncbi:MAG: tRNA uridine-5-carboxymethylaminomethyl(34) synthesis GTPase MnmE [Ignavibacteriales bacterium]|nr:tRNA uridine-5-carboxymethylaminomethyl(34) synthesis GTPase MnmE [Ignavibacteriales bacterium]
MNFEDDTIVALATPAGVGAISVIRVSGPVSISSVDKIFEGKHKLSSSSTHTIHYGKIFDENKELIDDVLISIFKKPNSYTGEESVEINTHGSSLITQKIIQTLLKLNIRTADPGEFTKRAFLNGRIDLAQAEAVADLINSRTEASFRGARNQLDGLLSQKVEDLRNKLVTASSLIELELDFAEEDLEFVSKTEVIKLIDEIILEIDQLLKTYKFGKVIRDGVNVVIVGKPNVGKSSLLNYILKESRAIVSDIPGTTRDVIREEVSIDGILFRLFDTAGIRSSYNEIEKEGISRSQKAVKDADIVIFLNDVTESFSMDLYNQLLQLTSKERILTVLNKIDLKPGESYFGDIKISALNGIGIKDLFNLLKEKAVGSSNYTEKSAIISSVRHYEALVNATGQLRNARKSAENKMSGEFISTDLRSAEESLGEIIGIVSSDDILNNIFAKFCIGK